MKHVGRKYKDPVTGRTLATCNGSVFIDRLYPIDKRIELYCLSCGDRWFIKRDGSAFATWLARQEVTRNALQGISS